MWLWVQLHICKSCWNVTYKNYFVSKTSRKFENHSNSDLDYDFAFDYNSDLWCDFGSDFDFECE